MAKKSTRVIHTRISNDTLIGCLDLLELGGNITIGIELSKVVRMVLSATIKSLREQSLIPKAVDDPNFTLDQRLGKVLEVEVEPGVLLKSLMNIDDFVQDKEEIVGTPLPREATDVVRREIRKRLDKLENPDVEIDGDLGVSAVDNVSSLKPEGSILTIDLDVTTRIDFADVRDTAPTNKWVVLSLSEPKNKPLRLAIEITMANFPSNKWKDDKVNETIIGLAKRLKSYDLSNYEIHDGG